MKFLKVTLVIVLSLMTVTSGLLVPGMVRGADTSDTPIQEISGSPASVEFYDVAWRTDGLVACFVGYSSLTGRGCVYWYDPSVTGAGAWTTVLVGGSGNPTSPLIRAVAWDAINGNFIAIGDCMSGGYWYIVMTKTFMQENFDPDLVGAVGYDLIYDSYNSRMLCAGNSPSFGATCFTLILSPYDWTILFYNNDANAEYRGIAIDTNTNYIYIVGTNYVGFFGIYSRYTGALQNLGPMGYGLDYAELYFSDIVYSPSANAMVLCVESRNSSENGIFYAYGSTFGTLVGIGEMWNWQMRYKQMAIDPTGTIIAVGYNQSVLTHGRIYRIWRDTSYGMWHISQESTDGSILQDKLFKAVAIRPARIPFALVAGSAFKYSYTSADSGIQVNAVIPHINFIDVYAAGTSTSYLNSPLDIDTGSNTVGYDFTVSVYSSAGQAYINMAELRMWRDNGVDENMPVGFTDPGYGNARALFVWTRGAPDVWTQTYPPVTGTEEITLVASSSSHVDEVDGQNVTLKFRVYFHQQARAALGPFTEPWGTRNANQQAWASFNNLNSWNIQMYVQDTGVAYDMAYDEFGIYQYTYIGVSGMPGGGAISGSGAPGLTVLLGPVADMTYSANCPYRLSASITNLVGDDHAGTIPATAFRTQGGNLTSTAMTGADVPLYYFGNPPTYQNPLDYGRTTTTSSGDFNVDADPVYWWCVIPVVVEDRYRGTITYTIGHG
jgi:hypothetical protein